MRQILAGAVMIALLPATVVAQSASTTFNVQNCALAEIGVAPLIPSDPTPRGAVTVARGETRSIFCAVAGCWLQIVYRTAPPYPTGTYQQAYSTDRCTRGPQDIVIGDLPAAGNCGC